ncbi:MAG: hypothetical protein QE284_00620 [Rhizobium sp.]|nr:hypothetical protein [Rhizobium sp.]
MRNLSTSTAASAASISAAEKATNELISALEVVRDSFAAGNVAANAPAATDREPAVATLDGVDRDQRLGLRHDLDIVLSLLDVAVHSLLCEEEYQAHQVRPQGLPCMSAVIKTLQVCSGKLEDCWSELTLKGDVDYQLKVWRPKTSGAM